MTLNLRFRLCVQNPGDGPYFILPLVAPSLYCLPEDRDEPRLVGHQVFPKKVKLSLIRPELRASPSGFRGVCISWVACFSGCLHLHWRLYSRFWEVFNIKNCLLILSLHHG